MKLAKIVAILALACFLSANFILMVRCKKRKNSCDSTLCEEGTHCVRNRKGQGICVCNEVCPEKYDPVCASDGNTYKSYCTMKRRGCKRRKELTKVHPGECKHVDKGR